jgi:hypothetical protein
LGRKVTKELKAVPVDWLVVSYELALELAFALHEQKQVSVFEVELAQRFGDGDLEQRPFSVTGGFTGHGWLLGDRSESTGLTGFSLV